MTTIMHISSDSSSNWQNIMKINFKSSSTKSDKTAYMSTCYSVISIVNNAAVEKWQKISMCFTLIHFSRYQDRWKRAGIWIYWLQQQMLPRTVAVFGPPRPCWVTGLSVTCSWVDNAVTTQTMNSNIVKAHTDDMRQQAFDTEGLLSTKRYSVECSRVNKPRMRLPVDAS